MKSTIKIMISFIQLCSAMRRFGIRFAFVVALGMASAWASDAPLVHLQASSLPPGELASWTNGAALGGAFTNAAALRPKVEEVAGRRAVVFDGSSWLGSDFPAPAPLAGSNPFTLVVWAFNPELKAKETMLSWASRPVNCAEFSYGSGRSRSEGAFSSFGAGNTGFEGGAPRAGEWHHLAFTYAGGSNGAFRIYVDGRLTTERSYSLRTKTRDLIRLGAGWDGRAKVPWTPFSGALAEVVIYDRELSEREVRNALGRFEAFRPSPADRAEVEALDATFRWQSGNSNAAKCWLLAGEDRAAVERATRESHGVFKAELPISQTEWSALPVEPGRTYYWRVAQSDARGIVTERGDVWQFRVSTGPTTEPRPRDGFGAVRRSLAELRWVPGRFAAGQTVWFGAAHNEVAGGKIPPLAKLDARADHVRLTAPLEFARTYYWRVATDNGAHAPDAGRVWSFRVADEPHTNDVTFFVSSDTHYGFADNSTLNKQTIDLMNGAPGLALPEKFGGGSVRTPRGVVLNGDLLDRGFDAEAPTHWSEFVRDYGLTGEDGRLGFPLYEGFGNHDGGPAKSLTRRAIRERNPRRLGLVNVSSNGLHYSWDWDHVHLVQLNLFGGDGSNDVMNVSKTEHDPEGALEFLKQDLAQHVGRSGRPVITFQHFSWLGGMSDWWTPEAKERFYEVVKDYQIAALINGHSHGASFLEWKGLQTIHDGSTARPDSGSGDFLIVRVTANELTVIQRKPDGWGISLKKALRLTGDGLPP